MTDSRYGALLDAVRGVHWRARHTVSSSLPGSHRSAQRGSSPEFTEYRLYRQGDDPRRLDWRLLARSDRAYIRLATDRAILPTTIVLDASRSMAFPVATRDKWRLAQEIAVGLAAVVHGDGDPVGVALHDAGRVRLLPPRTRRGIVADVTRVVGEAEPDGVAPLAPVVAALRTPRIAIITDLLGDADELLHAARLHDVAHGEAHLVHIVAREEIDPPRRPTLAADPEAPIVQRLLAESTRAGYERAFAEWRAEMARAWRASGATYLEVITGESAARAVRRVVELAASPGTAR
jgi:uncharacterized protein (DUF58 family)